MELTADWMMICPGTRVELYRGATIVFVLMFWMAGAAAAVTFPAGESDSVTPQIRVLKPKRVISGRNEEFSARVKISDEFNFCAECATDPATEYAVEGQVDLQGHVHLYLQRVVGNGFPSSRNADSFCAFNALNPTTQEVRPGVWESQCPTPAPGLYRMCATLETNAHASRVKAAPRDFPSVDCQFVFVNGRRRGSR